MTESVSKNFQQWTGDGATTAFVMSDVNVLASSYLAVYVDDTLKTITTDYTVSIASNIATVTFLVAPAAATRVTVVREEPLAQNTDLTTINTFRAEGFEGALDTIVRQIYRLWHRLSRSLTLPDSALDGSGQFDARSNRIGNVGDPTAAQDAVTKTYADATYVLQASGGGDMLASVYDPLAVAGDAFSMSNMAEGATNKILTATERTKLSGIETSATADQTGAEIKALYEVEANAFTDAQFTKLAGIATAATANSSDAALLARVNHTGTQLASTISDFSTAADARITASAQATATWEAGTGTTEGAVSPAKVAAAIAALASGGGDMFIATYDPTAVSGDAFAMDNMVEGATTKILTGTERTKLSGIETGATADQTGAEIKTAYEAEPSAFTDAQFTKLAGIATGATANDTDANLKARANHTGTQTASTISDFNSAADARITAATGVSVQAYDVDTAKTDVAQGFSAAQGVTPVALTDAASIATDAALSNVFTVTLGGNRTLSNPTNMIAGKVYTWIITQDGTGSRTLAYGSYFNFPGGTAPTLTTTAAAVDIITGIATSSTKILCNSALDMS